MPEDLQLIEPIAELESSHRSLLAEFRARDEEMVPWIVADHGESVSSY